MTEENWKLPFVWKLNYNGLISYAIGTKHNEPHHYTDDIEKIVQQVRLTCLEITPDMQPDEETIALQHQFNQEISTFIQELTDQEAKNRLTTIIQRLYGRTIPKSSQAGLSGVDGNILAVALKYPGSIHPLETHEERRPLLEILINRRKKTIALARAHPNTLDLSLDKAEKILDNTDQAYRSGDPSVLKIQNTYDKHFNDLNRERTQRMAYRSLQHIIEEPTLIAVGLGHFIAPQPTMLDLWTDKGVEVERIC